MKRPKAYRALDRLATHGYTVEKHGRGWTLRFEGSPLMIGEHGCVAPTQREAINEGLERIADDAR